MTATTTVRRAIGSCVFELENETQRYRTWRLVTPAGVIGADVLGLLTKVTQEDVAFSTCSTSGQAGCTVSVRSIQSAGDTVPLPGNGMWFPDRESADRFGLEAQYLLVYESLLRNDQPSLFAKMSVEVK